MENLISREALSGSLETFQPSMGFGIGITKTISKIKAPRVAKATTSPRTQKSAAKSTLATKAQAQAARITRTVLTRRFAYHAIAMSLVGVVVLSGSGANAKLAKTSLISTSAGETSTLDSSAQATVVAEVAKKAHLVVASEADQQAVTMNSQVALATVADDSLAKRTVVETAGAAGRRISTYNVVDGDTLSTIASRFGITTSTIKWANNLDDVDALKPGQALTILPMTGVLYTVKSGDTPDTLANAFQANAAQITSFNNAEIKGLAVGQQIIIPDGVKADAPKPAVRVASATSSVVTTLTRYAFSGNGYSYGYCTYYVASRRAIPSSWGNAYSWYYNAQANGFRVGALPVPGAIAWTPAGYYGHVAYVEQVSGGQVLVSEMNYNGGWNRVSSRWVSPGSFKYIY